MSLPYRTGYGDGNYGVRAFGVDGTVTEAVGGATLVSSVVSSAEVIKLGSASVSASSGTGTPTGEFMIDASASTSASASTTAAAEKIFLGGATASASITTASASIQFITNADGSTSASASFTSAGLRIGTGTIAITPASTFDADAFITAKGVADVTATGSFVTIDSAGFRVRLAEASAIQGSSSFSSTGRELWEPIPLATSNWSNIAA